MLKLTALLAALLWSGTIAQAAEASALKVYGFSPDGRYFAFAQHDGPGDAGHAAARITVVDAARDRFEPGFPVQIGPTEFEDQGVKMPERGEEALALAEKKAGARLTRYDAARPGQVLARDAEVRAGENRSQWAGTNITARPGGRSMRVTHPRLGPMELTLTPLELNWPRTSRHGRHKEAAPCAQEAHQKKAAGFRLTLKRGGARIVLAEDKTIPASRNCVLLYGLAEVHAFDRPDGAVTLAVLLDMHARGWEGEDRSFLAVTKIIKP